MSWKRVATIGAVQEESAVQEEDGTMGARRPFSPRRSGRKFTSKAPGPRPPPTFQVPVTLAERLKNVPGEVYDIFPGVPDTTTSTNLSVVTANAQGVIHTFTPPTGHYIILDPSDITQEVLLQPYTSAGSASSNYIPGLIEIFTRTGLAGKQERVYVAVSTFHRDDSNLAARGDRRKWQLGYVISPGDRLLTMFTSQGTGATASIGTGTTVLDHRVLAKKVSP